MITRNINNLLGKFGYRCSNIKPIELERHYVRQRKLFDAYKIDTIFDVGANIGQYGMKMRSKIDFKGRIISFEPMSKEFSQLSKVSSEDSLWEVANFALGKVNVNSEIQISGNSVSSSLLDMLPSVVETCGETAAYVRTEQIIVKTLDSIFNENYTSGDNVFLKIDTQGYEKAVLEGALDSLPNILGLQLELSFIQFYEGDSLYQEMINYVDKLGYKLMSIEPVLHHPESGRLLQIDGLFFRE